MNYMVFEEKHFKRLEELIKKGYLCKEMCNIEELTYKGDEDFFCELDDSALKRAFFLLDKSYIFHRLPYVELLDYIESFEEFEKYCEKNPTTLYIVPQEENDFLFYFGDMLISQTVMLDYLGIDIEKVTHDISLWEKEKEGVFSLKNWNPENNIQLQKLSYDDIYRLARDKGCDVIEHARISLTHITPMLKTIQKIASPAECVDIIEKYFDRMSEIKKWTESGDILIYKQMDIQSLYESFAYETINYISELDIKDIIKNDLMCKLNYYIQRIYDKTEPTPTLIIPVRKQTNTDESKSKFNFDEYTIYKIGELYDIISKEKNLCSKNKFITMFEDANFSSTKKTNGDAYNYISFVIYYFHVYICDKSIKNDWFEKACHSIGKTKKGVASAANKSKYWKNKNNKHI